MPKREPGFIGRVIWIGFFQFLFTMVVLMFPFIMYKTWAFDGEFSKRSVEGTGVIVDWHAGNAHRGSGHRVQYEVRFTTQDGQVVNFIDQTSVAVSAVMGQKVPIRYVPEDPKWAKITIEGLQEKNRSFVFAVLIIFWLISIPLAYLLNRAQLRNFRGKTGEEELETVSNEAPEACD